MDVLEILRKNGKDLLPEDLDLLRTELDTGAFDEGYIETCKQMISEIVNWQKGEGKPEPPKPPVPGKIVVSPDKLVPKGAGGIPTPPQIPAEKIILSDLQRLRADKDYRTAFKRYVKESAIINEDFIEKHFELFKDWELNAMLACIPFSEEFLEKYYSVLDSKMIALYQPFSESFFMKHYADLDAETVLTRGVNPWREKAKRSRQMDLFLRIKGVKL